MEDKDYKKLYEEAIARAKRYNEAIEIAREINNEQRAQPFNVMTRVFSELAESEDEEIRKALIHLVNSSKELYFGVDNYDDIKWSDILAWLEKKAEQKSAVEMKTPEESLGIDSETYNEIVDECIYGKQEPIDTVEPKFKVGDYIERKDGLGCHAKIIYIGKNVYGCEKLIYPKDSSPFFELMFENQDEFKISFDFQQSPAWTEEDEKTLNSILSCIDHCQTEDIEARYNGNHYIDPKRYEPMYDWLKSLKDRVQMQPKQEWSEKDEIKIESIIAFLKSPSLCAMDGNKDIIDANIKYLKSFKHRNRWKPSDEQMEALDSFIYCKFPNVEKYGEAVESLYNDLEKL